MSVAAVSHFVDDATDSAVVPDTSPTACSWITTPSAATIRMKPPDSPATRTRSSSNASAVSKASGANILPSVAPVVVVAATVVSVGSDVDVASGSVRLLVVLVVLVVDEPQPTS